VFRVLANLATRGFTATESGFGHQLISPRRGATALIVRAIVARGAYIGQGETNSLQLIEPMRHPCTSAGVNVGEGPRSLTGAPGDGAFPSSTASAARAFAFLTTLSCTNEYLCPWERKIVTIDYNTTKSCWCLRSAGQM
jgi:hypothetical protein